MKQLVEVATQGTSEPNDTKTQTQDDVDALFTMIARTVRQMPHDLRFEVDHEIFTMVKHARNDPRFLR